MFGKYVKKCKSAVKCDNQTKYKDPIESAMIYNTERINVNTPMNVVTLGNKNKPSARKYLNQFSELLNAKKPHSQIRC